MRIRSHHILLAVAVLLVVTLAVALWRTVRSVPGTLPLVTQLAPGVTQRARAFHRAKVKDGKTVWEVSAAEVEYRLNHRDARVRDVTLRWYLDDGRSIGLQSKFGRVELAGTELESASLEGNVLLSLGDYEVRLEQAQYDRAAQKIVSPGMVRLSGNGLMLTGSMLEVDLQRNQLVLARDVTMRVHPDVARKEASDASL